jgi:hypothetical protein
MSAILVGIGDLLLNLIKTTAQTKKAAGQISTGRSKPGLGDGRKHRVSVKLHGDPESRFSDIGESRGHLL